MKSGIGSENKSNKRKHLKYGRMNIVLASVLVLVQKWEGILLKSPTCHHM